MRLYAEAYHPLNGAYHAITRCGVGALATDTMVAHRDDLAKTTFHNEWSRPQGYHTKLGGVLLEEQGWRTVLMLTGREEFGRDEVRLLEMFTPHVKRAVQLNIRLAQSELSIDVTARLLAHPKAAFLVSADAQVLVANAAAEHALPARARRAAGPTAPSSPIGPRTTPTCGPSSQRARPGRPATASSGLNHASGPPTLLQIMPVRGGTPLLAPGLAAAIVFDVSQDQITDPAQALRPEVRPHDRRGGLRPGDRQGGDGKAAAERHGVSFATARTHLSRIFEKTGVHRQAELVRRSSAIRRRRRKTRRPRPPG